MPNRSGMGPRGPFVGSMRLSADAPDSYPYDLPAVRAIADVHFENITVFVGDNGTGKSTIVEALAVDAGFNPEGGSRNLRFATYDTHSELNEHLTVAWKMRPSWGWFLRAESFYGMASHIAADKGPPVSKDSSRACTSDRTASHSWT